MRISEVTCEIPTSLDEEATQPSPEEQRAKSLSDQSKRLTQQAKEVRAQQAIKRAQQAQQSVKTTAQTKLLPAA